MIHGQGASAHSHFHRADDYEAHEDGEHDDDHHHEEDEKVEHSSVEVDLRTELSDVVAWLPDIAAQSNLNEAAWTSANSTSRSLTKIIDAIGEEATDNEFRESWRKQSKEIEPMLDGLQTLSDASSGEAK